MFKCCECGQEYKIKPQYCECGNDTFDEVLEKIAEEIAVAPKSSSTAEEKLLPDEKSLNNLPQKRFDYLSLLIFIVCIILSILSLIFIGRNSAQKPVPVQQKVEPVKIPSIDELWVSQKVETVQKSQTVTTPVKISVQPPVVIQSTKAVQKPAQKSVATQQSKITAQKPVVKQVETPVKAVSTPNKPSLTAAQTKTPPAHAKPVPVQSTTLILTEQLKLEELNKYKIKLRNNIASKIKFINVVGDGSCAVSFKINASGKLINKRFSKESSNTTLNDAVYQAMLNTYSFNPPPEGYKNETLTLTVKIVDGNFQVGLK